MQFALGGFLHMLIINYFCFAGLTQGRTILFVADWIFPLSI